MKRAVHKVRSTKQSSALIAKPALDAATHAEAMFAAALECIEQRDADYYQGAEYLYMAALGGHGLAQYRLAVLLSEDRLSRHKYGTPHSWYQSAASNGITEAMCALAGAYMSGASVTTDIPRGLDLYMQAAAKGSAEAQFKLGLYFKDGAGPNRDLKKATRWLCQAARQGCMLAHAQLEQIYLLRLVRLYELDSDDRWFLVSIFSEDTAVWVRLGLSYLRGDRLPRNESEALRWLCKAAERGSAKALFNLGIMRIEGMGLAQDEVRGLHLMRAAAFAGYEPAERWLSVNGFSNAP
jgi:TPR repeat protein